MKTLTKTKKTGQSQKIHLSTIIRITAELQRATNTTICHIRIHSHNPSDIPFKFKFKSFIAVERIKYSAAQIPNTKTNDQITKGFALRFRFALTHSVSFTFSVANGSGKGNANDSAKQRYGRSSIAMQQRFSFI